MKGAFTLLHDSLARRDGYISVTGSYTFPLFFCATRWIEDRKVADRLINLWKNVTKVVRFWEKLPKRKQPSCKSFLLVQSAVNDQFSVAKFQFFSFVVSLFEPFLTVYQTDWPVLPFMYDDLTDLVRKLLQLFIKTDVLTNCTSGTALKQLDLTKKENFFSQSKLNIGFATELTISEMKRKDLVTNTKFLCLRNVVSATAETLFERSPLGSMIVKHVKSLDPKHFDSSNVMKSMKLLPEAFNIFKCNTCYHWV